MEVESLWKRLDEEPLFIGVRPTYSDIRGHQRDWMKRRLYLSWYKDCQAPMVYIVGTFGSWDMFVLLKWSGFLVGEARWGALLCRNLKGLLWWTVAPKIIIELTTVFSMTWRLSNIYGLYCCHNWKLRYGCLNEDGFESLRITSH